jgi:hypothetical protein
VEHNLLDIIGWVVSRWFKRLLVLVLVGEMGLNFYTVLDEAR